MKKKKLLTIIIAITLIAGSILTTSATTVLASSNTTSSAQSILESGYDSSVKLVVDKDNSETLPKNFRTSKDEISVEDAEGIDLTGLSDLNISGGAAMTENGLKAVQSATEGYDLIDIDLRQESHGLVNGMAISWYGDNDGANIGLTQKQVIKLEKNLLKKIKKDDYVSFDLLPNNKSVDIGTLSNLDSVQTEEQLAKSLDVDYIRIAATDHYKPTDDNVDTFVSKVRNLDDDTWLHFHCRGGKGRTTTFMAMYDMMHNAKKVSYEDILKRQQLLGGSDLITGNDEDQADPENSRSAFLQEFYDYCKTNNDNFKTKFSKYKKNLGNISTISNQ